MFPRWFYEFEDNIFYYIGSSWKIRMRISIMEIHYRVRDSWEFLVIKRLLDLTYDGGPSCFRDMFV